MATIIDFLPTILTSLIGIVCGYGASKYMEIKRDQRKHKREVKAVKNELVIVRNLLNTKGEPHEENFYFFQEDFPLVTDTYDCLRTELASWLEPDSFACLTQAYTRVKGLNSKRSSSNTIGFIDITGPRIAFTHDIKKDISKIDDAIMCLDHELSKHLYLK